MERWKCRSKLSGSSTPIPYGTSSIPTSTAGQRAGIPLVPRGPQKEVTTYCARRGRNTAADGVTDIITPSLHKQYVNKPPMCTIARSTEYRMFGRGQAQVPGHMHERMNRLWAQTPGRSWFIPPGQPWSDGSACPFASPHAQPEPHEWLVRKE
ncbi:uncharacterized protein BO80DRAFT_184904 [Aspergillus ibericus CBS 121593]|uniref:Uncharacterized protein n=1 Tax=Aspergillus ibericus CBS 121593 TaxID=1448316 RepID=A0A395GQG4_9EURO|nr:hypothetical protein BO80DRAFT_184904 [Aspergillus ibericus CBS 121593]RAK97719.1 hypothetical protein BO80DRAFT_184904 [Aspergillus ibericus CBS 121593]